MKKFVEKMKRFWSLNAKTSGGFTLVELIVVIAILAILAGIAVPAYSGYVEKAKKAEDEQLLATINTAFAAACIENGTDVHSVDNAAIELNTDKSVKAVTVPAGYDEAFQVFYAGNADKKFGVTEKILFDAELHMFVNPAEVGKVAMSYGGGIVYINAEDAERLAASTFITAEGLGAEGLLNKVNSVTSFAGLLLNDDDPNAFATVLGGDAYKQSLAKALGVSNADALSGTALEAALNDKMIALGLDNPEDAQKVMVNGAVLYAAQNATIQTEDEVITLLAGSDTKGAILANLNGGDSGKALSQAALAYGMYTAYAYSKGDQDLIDSTSNPIDILNGLEDPGFKEYMDTEQAEKDLQGYMSALNMINDSTDNADAVSSVLVNGFNDPNLIALVQQAIGQ